MSLSEVLASTPRRVRDTVPSFACSYSLRCPRWCRRSRSTSVNSYQTTSMSAICHKRHGGRIARVTVRRNENDTLLCTLNRKSCTPLPGTHTLLQFKKEHARCSCFLSCVRCFCTSFPHPFLQMAVWSPTKQATIDSFSTSTATV